MAATRESTRALGLAAPEDAAPHSRQSDASGRPRILVVDDSRAIHEDFRRILDADSTRSELRSVENALFGRETEADASGFEIDSAYHAEEALARCRAARKAEDPYRVVFMDVRMPPGIDGVEAAGQLLRDDSEVQVVLCTAHSDHGWEQITETFGVDDRLLILRKPFDLIAVRQLTTALSRKWVLARQAAARFDDLEQAVRSRTAELEAANAQLRHEIAERARIEVELRHSQKLEAVGQLAAGIAHEINTPLQCIRSNADFALLAVDTLRALCTIREQTRAVLSRTPGCASVAEQLERAEQEANASYLAEEVPHALRETITGIDKVSHIVNAMKAFSERDQDEHRPADLNEALRNAVTVSCNEYKHVARLEVDLGEIPPVRCRLSDLSQAFLNLIVNAAQAIADTSADADTPGVIRLRTWAEAESVVITIADTGCGISKKIQHRVFDPFFTTKPVGRGTGQGLAIARSIVVDKHNGSISYESDEGNGTVFTIRLPVDGSKH